MNYKDLIVQIQNLPWSTYDPKAIIYITKSVAIESDCTLHETAIACPGNQAIAEIANNELMTSKLKYAEYNRYADHSGFLIHFCEKAFIKPTSIDAKIKSASAIYIGSMSQFNRFEKVAIIFSVRQELVGIFTKILTAHDWASLGFGFFQYYLKNIIELYSTKNITNEFISNLELNQEPLYKFYKMRLDLYKSLEKY